MHSSTGLPEPPPAANAAPTRDPAWARPAFWALLLVTALLYLWDLGASGWANSSYAAAAQAGSASWKAFFFGSLDAASSITLDKTPLALWPMDEWTPPLTTRQRLKLYRSS